MQRLWGKSEMMQLLRNPELSLAKVARSLRISPRYLQRLLETAGISFASHVIELRLKQAFMLLTAQRESKVRISDIALQSGFSDVSYFNRLFRSRFGDTPSGVRGEAHRHPALCYQVLKNDPC